MEMLDTSIFWARILGLYFLIWSVFGFFRRAELIVTAKEISKSSAILTLSGDISLILGLVIVFDHPFWAFNFVGLITLIGYLFILRGIMRIGFAQKTKKFLGKVGKTSFMVILVIMFIIGLYLTYEGFAGQTGY